MKTTTIKLAIASCFIVFASMSARGEESRTATHYISIGNNGVSAPAQPCYSWQLNSTGCTETIEGLPDDVPRVGTVVTVNTTRNMAYLFRDGRLIAKGPAATGMNRVMTRGSNKWMFRTPHGRMHVLRKIANPVWTKPDWAYVEEGKRVPASNHPSRKVHGKLGKYALDLGDGIMIHGTDDPSSIGKKATHGCVRLPDNLMKRMFRESDVGTEVWVF